jgi:hypothetical protein
MERMTMAVLVSKSRLILAVLVLVALSLAFLYYWYPLVSLTIDIVRLRLSDEETYRDSGGIVRIYSIIGWYTITWMFIHILSILYMLLYVAFSFKRAQRRGQRLKNG